MSASISRGDVVAIEARAVGQLARVYPHVTALATFEVTRIDSGHGRRAYYLREIGHRERVVVAWPEQLKMVRRLVPVRGRAR